MASVLRRADPAWPGGRTEAVADRSPGAPSALARAGEAVLAVLLCSVAGFAFVAVPLAVAGWFHPIVVLPAAMIAALSLIGLWNPLRPVHRGGDRIGDVASGGWGWVAAGLIAIVSVAASFATVDQHVLQDRDPGHYVNAALWLAADGSLVVPAEVGPFGDDPAITARVRGTDVREDGSATFQSLHLLPTMAAAASWGGGDGALFRTGLALGGLALLAMYGLTSRLVRPGFAVAATAALAANLGFVFLTRNLYSEVPLLLLVLGGLWTLDIALADRSVRRGLVAGAVLGAALLTRIDAPLHLMGLVPAGAMLAVRARRSTGDGGRSVRDVLGIAGAVMIAGYLLASLDGLVRSRAYLSSHADEFGVIGALLVASSAVAAVTLLHERWPVPASMRRLSVHRRALGVAAAVAVVAVAGGLVFVRPAVQVDHQVSDDVRQTRSLQAEEGEPIDGRRSYAEDSARWQVWYLGPVTAIAAVAGAALLVGRVVAGRGTRLEVLLVSAGALPLMLYLVRPSIYPDQPWAMRRFLPLPTPVLLAAAAVAADRLWSWSRGAAEPTRTRRSWHAPSSTGATSSRSLPSWARASAGGVAVLIAVSGAGHGARVLAPVRGFHSYTEYGEVVRHLCRTMGDDVAVVVLPSRSIVDETLPQALRSMCDVPAAAGRRDPGAPPLDGARLASLAQRWDLEDGRRLWVVADDPNRLTGRDVPVAFDETRRSGRELQPTLTRVPDSYRVTTRRLVAGPAPVAIP